MSRSLDAHTRRRRGHAGGFTLVEVIVALGLVALVAAAVFPQIIVGLRATGVSRDVTQAKGVAQARLEQMRSMPFYVGREAGDYIDILDTYYRNTTPPAEAPVCGSVPLTAMPKTTWTGYVPASATHCAWEPAGPLYRRVISPIESPGLGAFAMVVSTQFIAGATPPTPVPPLAGYNSQTAGADQPASSQVGVTIAVFYRTHGGINYTQTYSQMERSAPMDPLIKSKAQATTVHVASAARTWSLLSSTSPDPAAWNEQTNLLATIGTVNLTGELFTGSRVVANATSAAGSTSLPSAVTGAATNLIAPPDVAATGTSASDQTLPNGCTWICFGGTKTDQVSAISSNGLPNAGTPTAPARAMLTNGNKNGFTFDNGVWPNNKLQLRSPMVSLDTSVSMSMPGVRDCVVGASGASSSPSYLTATGFLRATPLTDFDPEVAACATGQSGVVRLFLTDFAPQGVVKVTVTKASAHCRVRTRSTSTATADYSGKVEYWNGSGYSLAGNITPSNTIDPLQSVPLDLLIDPDDGLRLRDYIESWSSLLPDEIKQSTTSRAASIAIPGVVRIVTAPTRYQGLAMLENPDRTSAISLTVGAVSCEAGDAR